MHLDKLYQLYLEQAKNRVLSFPDNDRARICQWIKVIEQSPNPDEEVRKQQLHSLKLLLLCLESNLFSEPFEKSPEEDKNFTEYKWDSFNIDEYSDMIRARRNNCPTPDTSYAVSGNRRRLMTYQNNPRTGQHCYYAHSNEPVERWDNLHGGAVQDESIKEWSGLGDYEELNSKVSGASFEAPRCDPAPNAEEQDSIRVPNQSLNRSQTPTRCVLPQNSPRGPPPRSPQIARPQTPQRFGGQGPRYARYAPAQFGLSPNEQFRSPRGVFENLEYEDPDRPRFTDEIIAELDAARRRYASPVPTDSETRARLQGRLQQVRENMNRRSSSHAQAPEVCENAEPSYHYDPIALNESVNDQSDLGILSAQEMNLNDSIFGDQLMQSRAEVSRGELSRAERSIAEHSKDDSLVSRNVKKIATESRIQAGQREVVEEILEEEINVEPQEPENLMDVSQPSFLRSPPALSPSPVCDNLMDVSQPSFESPPGYSPLRPSERIPADIRRTYKPRRLFADSGDRSQIEYSRERLDHVSMPSFASTPSRSGRQEYSERHEDVCQPDFLTLEDSGPRPPSHHITSRRLPDVEMTENLDMVSEPSLRDISMSPIAPRRTPPPCRPLPVCDISERLDDVSQPGYASPAERLIDISSPSAGSRRQRSRTSPRPLPQVVGNEWLDDVCEPEYASEADIDVCERIDDVSAPEFDSIIYEPLSPIERPMPDPETSERLDSVCAPSFQSSFDTSSPARQKLLSRAYENEFLDDVSQPPFPDSFNVSSIHETSRRFDYNTERPLPPCPITERLSDVGQPEFPESFESTYDPSWHASLGSFKETPPRPRPLPTCPITERLSDVGQPEFESFESSFGSQRRRTPITERPLPTCPITERLSDVGQPEFPSFESSFDYNERLSDVGEPSWPESEASSRASKWRRTPVTERPLPTCPITERLSDVDQPEFPESFESFDPNERSGVCEPSWPAQLDSSRGSQRRRTPVTERPLPTCPITERISDVGQPEFPDSFESTYDPSWHASLGSFKETPRRPRPLPTCPITERLSDVGQPEFESFESSFGSQRRRTPITERPLPTCPITERLSDVGQPEFPSFESSFDYNERLSDVGEPSWPESEASSRASKWRRTPVTERPLPTCPITERLSDVAQPEFPESFESFDPNERSGVCEPSWPAQLDSSRGSQRRRTPVTERPLPTCPITERISDVGQPDFPESFESSYDPSWHASLGSFKETPPRPRPLPTCPITERLSDVAQPQFESFESSFGSQRRRTPITERPLPTCPITERLSDVGQPEFPSFESSFDYNERLSDVGEPSWPESEASSRASKWRRTPVTERPLPTCPITERLSDVAQPEFPESFESFDPNERSGVCEPSWPAQLDSSRGSQRRRTPVTERPLPTCPITERISDVGQPEFPESFESTYDPSWHASLGSFKETPPRPRPLPTCPITERLSDVAQPEFESFASSFGSQRRRTPITERPLPTCPITERLSDVGQPEFPSFESSFDPNERLSDVCQPSFPESFDSSRGSHRSPARAAPQRRTPPQYNENLDDVSMPSFPSTPVAAPRERPHRQLFPSDNRRSPFERPGDYREAFSSLANYAPFEEQVRPRPRTPLAERLKCQMKPGPGTSSRQPQAASRMRPPAGSRMPQPPSGRTPGPSTSGSRIQPPGGSRMPLPPSGRTPGPSTSGSRIQPPGGSRMPLPPSRTPHPSTSGSRIQPPGRSRTPVPPPCRTPGPSTSGTRIPPPGGSRMPLPPSARNVAQATSGSRLAPPPSSRNNLLSSTLKAPARTPGQAISCPRIAPPPSARTPGQAITGSRIAPPPSARTPGQALSSTRMPLPPSARCPANAQQLQAPRSGRSPGPSTSRSRLPQPPSARCPANAQQLQAPRSAQSPGPSTSRSRLPLPPSVRCPANAQQQQQQQQQQQHLQAARSSRSPGPSTSRSRLPIPPSARCPANAQQQQQLQVARSAQSPGPSTSRSRLPPPPSARCPGPGTSRSRLPPPPSARCPGPSTSKSRLPPPPSANAQQQSTNPSDGERLVKKSSVKFTRTTSTFAKDQPHPNRR